MLRTLLGIALLPVYLYVPGAVLLSGVGRRAGGPLPFAGREEWVFVAAVVSLLVTGVVGLTLAQIGLFSWWLVLLVNILLSVALSMRAWNGVWSYRGLLQALAPPRPAPQRMEDRKQARLQRFGLLGVALLALVLFSRPAEMLRGALDSGVYINSGVGIGRTGAIFQRDLLMRQLNDDAGEGRQVMQELNRDRYTLYRLRMPGFYVYDKQAALVVPQHYSLFPVWIGLLYSLFGIWGALYATPLLAFLSVVTVYFFARRALTPGAALLALLFLVLCPVTIWFARYPIAEVLTGLLAFIGFYAFMRMIQADRLAYVTGSQLTSPVEPPAPSARPWALFWGALAGVALGQIALARADFIFYLAPIVPYLLYWRLGRRWRSEYSWFAGGLLMMLVLFLVHFFFFSFGYTLDLYHNVLQDIRRLWSPLLLALYVGVPLLILLDRLYSRLAPVWLRAGRWIKQYAWLLVGAIVLAVGVYAIYRYLVGPWLPNLRTDNAGRALPQEVITTWQSYIGAPVDLGERYNLLRIGWYLSPLGMLLGVVGFLRLIWNRLNAATGLFFGVFFVLTFIFLEESYTDPHYIYTMRRYIAVTLPGLLLGAAWACQFLWARLRPRTVGRVLAGALASALCIFFIYTSQTIVKHVEANGAVQQLSDLAARIPEKSVVLFSNERDEPFVVATPLQYIFGIESFVLNRPYPDVKNEVLNGMVERWRKQGYNVWVLMSANGGKLNLPSYSLKEEGAWDYDVPEFEQLLYQKPYNVSRSYLPWGLYSVQAKTPSQGLPFSLDIGVMDYKWLVAGFYLQEQAEADSSPWRWTGDHSVLRLPLEKAGDGKTFTAATLKLRLRPETPVTNQGAVRKEPVTVTLRLGESNIGQVTVPPGTGFVDYTVRIPAGVAVQSDEPDGALLHILAPTWSGQRAGISYDQRALGIQIDSVEVTP